MKRDQLKEMLRKEGRNGLLGSDAPIADVLIPKGANEGEYAPHVTKKEMVTLWKKIGFDGEPVHLGHNLWGGVTLLNPKVSDYLLDEHNYGNRNPNLAHSGRIGRDISRPAGWVLTHMAMGIRRDGKVQDCQHRLLATRAAQLQIPILVVLNVCDEAQAVIDSNLKRKVTDQILITTGKDLPAVAEGALTRAVIGSGKQRTLTVSEKIDLFSKYGRAIEWVMRQIPKGAPGQTRTAPVLAAHIRAYFHVPHARLREHITMLGTGRLDHAQDDSYALQCRMQLTGTTGRKMKPLNTVDKFLLTLKSIEGFVERSYIDKTIRWPKVKEIYDLPAYVNYEETLEQFGDEESRQEEPEGEVLKASS